MVRKIELFECEIRGKMFDNSGNADCCEETCRLDKEQMQACCRGYSCVDFAGERGIDQCKPECEFITVQRMLPSQCTHARRWKEC